MAKPDPQTAKKEQQKKTRRWVITIFLATIAISAAISLASDFVMGKSSMGVAFLILLMIVFIGILFDIVGMAVATADEKPFHAMASRKVRGAKECIMLLRNAERVSSICNDVVGDICGVVSGTASAAIATQILQNFELSFASVVPLVLSSLTAALTVGGKAIGKGIAVSACTQIVYRTGQIIYFLTHLKELFRRKNSAKKKK